MTPIFLTRLISEVFARFAALLIFGMYCLLLNFSLILSYSKKRRNHNAEYRRVKPIFSLS